MVIDLVYVVKSGSIRWINSLIQFKCTDSVLPHHRLSLHGCRSGITYFQHMGASFVVSVLGVMADALVEARWRRMALERDLIDSSSIVVPISVFWLVLQYALHDMRQ